MEVVFTTKPTNPYLEPNKITVKIVVRLKAEKYRKRYFSLSMADNVRPKIPIEITVGSKTMQNAISVVCFY
jgi:hypothetical protein